jgi:hypothetical protein
VSAYTFYTHIHSAQLRRDGFDRFTVGGSARGAVDIQRLLQMGHVLKVPHKIRRAMRKFCVCLQNVCAESVILERAVVWRVRAEAVILMPVHHWHRCARVHVD